MTVSPSQLQQLARVLDQIDEGRIATPRVPGSIGQYLREYAEAKVEAATRLGVPLVARTWVSGDAVGPISLAPITGVELSRGNELMGSVASVTACSELLGTTLRVSLWSAARTANRAQRIWRRHPGRVLSLSGPYRWYPPARITPGEAVIEEQQMLGWHQLRCLKYTGDDLGRPARAAAHHLDWMTDPPGIRTFRVCAIRKTGSGWAVLPGMRERPPNVSVTVPRDVRPNDATQLLVLACAEPWAPDAWHTVAAVKATDNDVLAHNVTWADHVRELRGEDAVTADDIRALLRRLRAAGLRPSTDAAAEGAELSRRVSPRAREFAGWLRGTS